MNLQATFANILDFAIKVPPKSPNRKKPPHRLPDNYFKTQGAPLLQFDLRRVACGADLSRVEGGWLQFITEIRSRIVGSMRFLLNLLYVKFANGVDSDSHNSYEHRDLYIAISFRV